MRRCVIRSSFVSRTELQEFDICCRVFVSRSSPRRASLIAQRRDRTESTSEANATRYSKAPAACEYSHWRRSDSQFSGNRVQFCVAWRTARSVKDELTRRVQERLEDAGIPIASQTLDVSTHAAE